MQAETREAFGAESELIEGSGGVFEVRLDGRAVFDKASRHRFPEPGETASLVRALMAG